MKIQCPSCEQRLEIPKELAGKTIECPVCNKSVTTSAKEEPTPLVPRAQAKTALPPILPAKAQFPKSTLGADTSKLKMHNDGVYKSKLPVQSLVNDLISLAELDKMSEKKISFWSKVRTVFFVLGGLSFLGFPILCIPGIGLIIAGCVIHFGTLKKISKDEFPDYRYQLCQKIVGLISVDMGTYSELDTQLNLKPQLGTPIIEKGKSGSATWNRQHTTEGMMSLSGVFLDGTKFRCSLTEDVQAFGEHFPYRSLSGKTKTKLKANKRTRWTGALRLRFKEKRYGASPTERQQLEDLMQLPVGGKLKKLDINPQEILLVVVTGATKQKTKVKMSKDIPGAWNQIEPDEKTAIMLSDFMAQMFLNLYQALNSSKTKKK